MAKMDGSPSVDGDYEEYEEGDYTPGRKTPRKSAAGRRLMRWTPALDQQLLLCVDFVCTKEGIHIPWESVGKEVNDFLSGEAIKQHLAKLRQHREAAGQPVPPKLDKSGRSKPSKPAADPKAALEAARRSGLLHFESETKNTKRNTTKTSGVQDNVATPTRAGGKTAPTTTQVSTTTKKKKRTADSNDSLSVKKKTKRGGRSARTVKREFDDGDDDDDVFGPPKMKKVAPTLRARPPVNYAEGEADEIVEEEAGRKEEHHETTLANSGVFKEEDDASAEDETGEQSSFDINQELRNQPRTGLTSMQERVLPSGYDSVEQLPHQFPGPSNSPTFQNPSSFGQHQNVAHGTLQMNPDFGRTEDPGYYPAASNNMLMFPPHFTNPSQDFGSTGWNTSLNSYNFSNQSMILMNHGKDLHHMGYETHTLEPSAHGYYYNSLADGTSFGVAQPSHLAETNAYQSQLPYGMHHPVPQHFAASPFEPSTDEDYSYDHTRPASYSATVGLNNNINFQEPGIGSRAPRNQPGYSGSVHHNDSGNGLGGDDDNNQDPSMYGNPSKPIPSGSQYNDDEFSSYINYDGNEH